MENYLRDNSIIALHWFTSFIGEKEWISRRKRVVSNFQKTKEGFTRRGARKTPPESLDDYAYMSFQDDKISWYMYLMENWEKRPECDEPSQSARIGPFFSAIGYYKTELEQVINLDQKLYELLQTKKNNPDSLFFEMLIAICYVRNGYKVEFLPENPPHKTPDLKVNKGEHTFLVECKRLDKTTGYAMEERKERNKKWAVLRTAMLKYAIPCYAEITCHKPIEEISSVELVRLFKLQISSGLINTGKPSNSSDLSIVLQNIDMPRVKKHFKKFQTRFGSPDLINIFTEKFDPFGDYTSAIGITALNEVGPADDDYAYNLFVDDVSNGYIAKWLNFSEKSMDKKAKDVKKIFSKAVKQVSDDTKSIIHIGYETLHGPEIEFIRHEKIKKSLSNFDFGEKQTAMAFCHALQPITLSGTVETAETTIMFGRGLYKPDTFLPNNLLLCPNVEKGKKDTHWKQDYDNRNSS